MTVSLYEKYGEFSMIHSIISLFYKKILDSDNLYHYFENVDMQNLIEHQTRFFCSALGGPQKYDRSTLKKVHQRFQIKSSDFDEVATLLKKSLEEVKMEDQDITTVINIVASYKNDIVTSAVS